MFDLWADQERDRLRDEFQSVLEDDVRGAIGAASWRLAVERARRLVAIAPYESSAALLLASALDGDGRGREAITTLEAFAGRCAEIGVLPPAEIQQRLAEGQPPADPFGDAAPKPAATPVAAFVGRAASRAVLNRAWAGARLGRLLPFHV